jgi:hypothetical protein
MFSVSTCAKALRMCLPNNRARIISRTHMETSTGQCPMTLLRNSHVQPLTVMERRKCADRDQFTKTRAYWQAFVTMFELFPKEKDLRSRECRLSTVAAGLRASED